MKMTAKFEAEGESFNACFEQLNSAFNAEFSASGGGQDGKDGATFTPSVSEDGVISWTNDRELPNPAPVNIKGAKGDKGADGADGITPVKGIDYFTEQDVQEIAERAAEMVDVPEGGSGVTSWNDLTDKPDFAPVATSGSWNDLTDKPFYEETPEPITWDGNVEGRETTYHPFMDMMSIMFGGQSYEGQSLLVKMSDDLYTEEQLRSATITDYSSAYDVMVWNGEDMGFITEYDGLIVRDKECKVVCFGTTSPVQVSMGGELYTLQAPSIGTYFNYADGVISNVAMKVCVMNVTFPEKVKPLDEKYLPDSVVLESELEGKGYQTEEQVTALINEAISNLPRYNGEVEEI